MIANAGPTSDLGPALAIMAQAEPARSAQVTRIYLDRLAYTPEMLAEAAVLYTYALLDSPQRMLDGMGIAAADIQAIRQAMAAGGPAAAARHVTPEMIRRYQIAGTPDECRAAVRELIGAHRLDVFVMNIVSGGLAANRRLLEDVRDIVQGS